MKNSLVFHKFFHINSTTFHKMLKVFQTVLYLSLFSQFPERTNHPKGSRNAAKITFPHFDTLYYYY